MEGVRYSDLMIGNIIMYGNPIKKNLPIYTITGIMKHTYYFSDGSSVSSGNSNVNGVPLTEDWLVKFGFTNKSHSRHYDLGKITIAIADSIHVNGRVYYNSWAIRECTPKSVHQLQNLYYLLTGEKLSEKGDKGNG